LVGKEVKFVLGISLLTAISFEEKSAKEKRKVLRV